MIKQTQNIMGDIKKENLLELEKLWKTFENNSKQASDAHFLFTIFVYMIYMPNMPIYSNSSCDRATPPNSNRIITIYPFT